MNNIRSVAVFSWIIIPSAIWKWKTNNQLVNFVHYQLWLDQGGFTIKSTEKLQCQNILIHIPIVACYSLITPSWIECLKLTFHKFTKCNSSTLRCLDLQCGRNMDYLKEILPGFDFGQLGSHSGAGAHLADSEGCDTLNWKNVKIHIISLQRTSILQKYIEFYLNRVHVENLRDFVPEKNQQAMALAGSSIKLTIDSIRISVVFAIDSNQSASFNLRYEFMSL